MSIEQAFNSLRWSLAKSSADRNGHDRIEYSDWEDADMTLNQMNHAELLKQMSLHEEGPQE